MTVRAGAHARGAAGFPAVPEWLGKNSSRNKKRRLLAELSTHLGERVSGGQQARPPEPDRRRPHAPCAPLHHGP